LLFLFFNSKTEAVLSSEMSTDFYRAKQTCISYDSSLNEIYYFVTNLTLSEYESRYTRFVDLEFRAV
jgi:hypothetical protein